MQTRMLILPFGDLLLEELQFVGYSKELLWHLYHNAPNGDRFISVKGKKSKSALMRIAKKWNWIVKE
jgi:hypothetical protein